jgi:hypothetical protein
VPASGIGTHWLSWQISFSPQAAPDPHELPGASQLEATQTSPLWQSDATVQEPPAALPPEQAASSSNAPAAAIESTSLMQPSTMAAIVARTG